LSEEVIKRIAAAFQVPYSVIMSEYQNKDTSKTNIEEFHTSAIEPMMKNIEESLTLHLQELTGTTERITHDRYEWIDPTQKLEREKFYYEIGVLDADYFVNMEGFKKLAPNSNVNNANSQLKLKSDITNLKRTLYWQQKDATNTRFTDTMQSKLQTVVKELEKQVIASVKATKGKGEKGLRMPTDMFDITSLMELTLDLLGNDWDKFLVGRLRSAEADIDVTPDPLSAYEQYIKDTTRTTTDLIKESYLNMGDEIKDAIQRTVELNPYATDDELIDLVEDSIKNKTGQLSKARTRTIARTTATAMNGSAQHRVYSKFGATTVWISRRDNDTRDDHRDADGKSPDAEGYFKVGTDRMKYPGGGGSAKQNVNCRCILGAGLAVVSDDDV
jgi:methionine aminopeptidase